MDNMQANPVGKIKKDIYIIKNDINNKIYIGQSLDAEKRFLSHCKKNKDNSLIDKAIQKYGAEHFWYEILESQIENYNEREKYWINYYNSLTPDGYNILSGGENPPIFYGNNHPNTKLLEEQLKQLKEELRNTNISLSVLSKKYDISKKQILRINQGISRAEIGEEYPIRKNPNINGKLSEEQVEEIIELLKFTYRFNGDIAREYGVGPQTIKRINDGILHHKKDVIYPIRKWKSCGKIPLTYEQVTDIIKEILNTNHSLNSIAKKYNVSFALIKGICSGSYKTYKRDSLQYPLRPF